MRYVLAKQTQQPKTVKHYICILLNTATSVLHENKLLRVASRALRLSEKYWQFLSKLYLMNHSISNKKF